jgi:hypothetical protein
MMRVRIWLPWDSARALFERSVIGPIENTIDLIINTSKHGIGRENNEQHVAKINFALRG